MLATVEREIGGMPVSVTKFGARRALRLAGKIGKIVAPALAQTKVLAADSLDQLKLEDLAPVVSALFSQIDNDGFDATLRDILCTTVVVANGRRVELKSDEAIDTVFGDDVLQLVRVAGFAIEVNFGDFIGGLLDGMRTLKGAAGSPKIVAPG